MAEAAKVVPPRDKRSSNDRMTGINRYDRAWPMLAVAILLAGCEPAGEALNEKGVCYRRVIAKGAGATLQVVARGIVNLETCAARLEVFRQREGAAVSGSYQGHYLFVDAHSMMASRKLDGPRFRILEDGDRVQLQASVARLLEAERRPRRSGPPVMPN